MNHSYFTIFGEFENTIIIERSKFLCFIKGVEDEIDAKLFVEKIKKKHSLATHNCYAYIADDKGLVQKFSDDGEPQGTAGLPMLEVLKNKKLYKTAVVVTRYFGGIKLGTGGLTRAYSGSVTECLEKCKVKEMCPAKLMQILPDYDGYSILLKLINNENIKVIKTDFGNSVNVELAIKEDFYDTFKSKVIDSFNGKINVVDLDFCFYPFG